MPKIKNFGQGLECKALSKVTRGGAELSQICYTTSICSIKLLQIGITRNIKIIEI